MKRIFIAIKINPVDSLKVAAADFRTVLRHERIKWTDTANMHVTLVFLGDTAEVDVARIRMMMKEVCAGYGAFNLIVCGAGVFRNLKDPKVLWLGIEQSDNLNELFFKVRAGLADLGIVTEERAFSPHLTLGRVKSLSERGVMQALLEKYKSRNILSQQVHEVILYESILLPEGPVYKPIAVFNL